MAAEARPVSSAAFARRNSARSKPGHASSAAVHSRSLSASRRRASAAEPVTPAWRRKQAARLDSTSARSAERPGVSVSACSYVLSASASLFSANSVSPRRRSASACDAYSAWSLAGADAVPDLLFFTMLES